MNKILLILCLIFCLGCEETQKPKIPDRFAFVSYEHFDDGPHKNWQYYVYIDITNGQKYMLMGRAFTAIIESDEVKKENLKLLRIQNVEQDNG